MRLSLLLALVAAGATPVTTPASGVVVGATDSIEPTQVAWVRHLPGEVSAVEAGFDTALALTAEELVAVDGLTGEVRWTRPAASDRTLDVLATPDGMTALVVEMADGRTQVIGVNTTDGTERFRVDYPAAHRFFPTDPVIHPRRQLGVSNDAFLFLRDAKQIVVSSLDTGDAVSVVELPTDCSVAASWWGPAQSTARGVIVPCSDPTAPGRRGGYAFLETSTGEFTWRDTRPGLVSDPLTPPRVAPDGSLALLRFWSVTPGGGGAVADAIVDVLTGSVLAEDPMFLGVLGRDHTWLETGELSTTGDAVFTDLDSGAEVAMTSPCPGARPILAMRAGVMWFTPSWERASWEPACNLLFTDIDGAVRPIVIDVLFERIPSIVAVGETFVLHAGGADLVGLR